MENIDFLYCSICDKLCKDNYYNNQLKSQTQIK